MPDLPPEMIEKIAKFSTPAMAQFAGSCKTFHSAFQPELDKRAAKQLLAYVLNPTPENIVKAKAMYAANPRILFIKTEGIEPASGIEEYVDEKGQPATRAVHRKFIGSPFQAALGTGDSALYKDMAKYFDKVEQGVERALQQIQEKFPNGFAYPPCDDNFNASITAIVTAITNDQSLINDNNPSEATQALIAKFRKDFLPTDVTQGHHFNLNHLIKAFKTYNQNWEPWNGNQQSLFWRQVIGYLERFVPVVDAQAFCQGLYYLLEQKQPQARGLAVYNYVSSSNISYFDDTTAGGRLGFDFGIEIWPRGGGRAGIQGAWHPVRERRGGVNPLSNYAEQKQQNLATLSAMLSSGLSSQPSFSAKKKCTIV